MPIRPRPLVRRVSMGFIALALLGLLGSAGHRAAAQATEGTVRLTPAMTNVEAKTGAFSVFIVLEDLAHYGRLGYDDNRDTVAERFVDSIGLAAFEFNVQYDQSLLEFQRFATGPELGRTGRDFYCLPADEELNKVKVACVSPGPEPPGPQGTLTLGSFTFRPLQAGTSALLLDAGLTGPLGSDPVPVEVYGGVVRVTGSAGPGLPGGEQGPGGTDGGARPGDTGGGPAEEDAGSLDGAQDPSSGASATAAAATAVASGRAGPGFAGATPGGQPSDGAVRSGGSSGDSEAESPVGEASGGGGGSGSRWLIGALGGLIALSGLSLVTVFVWRRRSGPGFGEL